MIKRSTRAGLAVALLVGTTAACGLAGSSAGGDAGATRVGNCKVNKNVQGSGPVKGPITGSITFQTMNLKASFKDYFTSLIAAFEKKYPGTHVNWTDDPGDATFTQETVTKANACALPDVADLNIDTVKALTNAHFLLNFDQKTPGAGKPFVPSIWNSIQIPGAGGHTALPWYWAPAVQTFNTELMTKAGLDPDKPPTTVMEMLQAWDKVAKAARGKYAAFVANPAGELLNQLYAMGIKTMSGDHRSFTFASNPQMQAWLAEYAKLYHDGALPKDSISSQEDPSTRYSEGKLVWGSTNPSFLRNVQTNSPQLYPKTGVAPYPFSNGTSYVGEFVAVPVTSANPATAVAFSQFLLSAENQTAWCKQPQVVVFPTTTESLADPFFTNPSNAPGAFGKARTIAAEEAKSAKLNPERLGWDASVKKVVVPELQLAIQGSKSVNDALNDAQNAANNVLSQEQHQ